MPLFQSNIPASQPAVISGERLDIPAGLWLKCDGCGQTVFQNILEQSANVCPLCGYHYPLSAWKRIELLVDSGSFVETEKELTSTDPLQFAGNNSYPAKLNKSRAATGMNDAVITGYCTIGEKPVVTAVMDFRFMGASMGSVVGEKITRAIELATRTHKAVLLVTASGGARMQEGVLSLMQMAKTSGALMAFQETGLPCIILLTHPTTGGVTASFASLGDIIFAEPGAMIGFAGPRVIKQTTHAKLPGNFQRAEFLQEHGFIDHVLPRSKQRAAIQQVLLSWNSL